MVQVMVPRYHKMTPICYNSLMKNFDIYSHDLQTFNLISTLISIINRNNDDDTNCVLANFFLNHLEELEQLSVYEIADRCYTSRSSVQRFIKDIGFDSYNNLKNKVHEALRHNCRYRDFYKTANFQKTYQNNINEMFDNFNSFYESEHFEYFVNLIYISKKIVFSIAEGSSVAPFDFQEALISLGKTARVITNGTNSTKLLESLTEDDLLITLSMTGNYALATLNNIKNVKANKVLITLNHSNIFNDVYDKIIYFANSDASRDYIQDGHRDVYTIYGFTYFFDLVLNRYFEKYSD